MTRVKICGITNVEDALAAASAGADYLGFVFYPPSPRYVTPRTADEIIRTVRSFSPSIRMAGVFVNEPVAKISSMAEQCGLDLLQLHGDESPETVLRFSPFAYKSIRPRDLAEVRILLGQYGTAVGANEPAYIVDSYHLNLFGGTGERADWSIAREIASQFPVFLAGGLTPENVSMAIASAGPWGVDVSSGVERAPGVKDHAKMRDFIRAARNVGVLQDEKR